MSGCACVLKWDKSTYDLLVFSLFRVFLCDLLVNYTVGWSEVDHCIKRRFTQSRSLGNPSVFKEFIDFPLVYK